jgi:hypothetical protein
MSNAKEHFPLWDLSDPLHRERFMALARNLVRSQAVITNMDILFPEHVDRVKTMADDERIRTSVG